jgi:hypothetical protein
MASLYNSTLATQITPVATTDTSTARTLSPSDVGTLINFTNAGTVTVTIDSDANQPITNGAIFVLQNKGGSATLLQIAGSTAFATAGGTIANASNPVVGQSGYIILQKLAANYWTVLEIYETYNHGTTFTWGSFTTPSQAVKITRANRRVAIDYPFMGNFSSTQTSFLQANTAAPTRFRPSAIISSLGSVSTDGGTTQTNARFASDTGGILYVTSQTGSTFASTGQILTEGHSLFFSN